MLACKRGHVNVIESLVANGAEIYINDNRNRTAIDTATRRNHINLIPILDSQHQILLMQKRSHVIRSKLIATLRKAYLSNQMILNPTTDSAITLLENIEREKTGLTSIIKPWS